MTKQEKRAYFEAIQVRYRRASKSRKTTILNEFCEVCGYRVKESAWKRLIDFAVSLKKDIPESSVPSHLHIAWMIGANRQIVMWEEWQFTLMRSMLEYIGIDQSRYQVIHTGRIEPELIERAEKYGFRPLPQKSEKSTIQIDTAHFGDNKLVDVKVRCAAVWIEDDESAIRSSFDLIAMFSAFAFSVWSSRKAS